MQDMTDALIENFFKGLCTKEEASEVLAYLQQHPEHPYLLHEWDTADASTPLPAHYTQEMYDVVEAHVKKTVRHRILLWRMAAACIMAAAVSVWVFNMHKNVQLPQTASRQAQGNEWIGQKNNTDTVSVIVLDDGSKITLFPQASVRYRNNFAKQARRDIYMSGEAYFEVAKNKLKPFTVYSGYISTTALGTAFRVVAPSNKDNIKVRLNEGKVVVVVTDTLFKNIHPGYYLLPGQELVFIAKKEPATIHTFIKNKIAVQPVAVKQLQRQTDQSYIFNNQTLADVLDQLAIIYHVKIRYADADIGTMYFIGKIDTNEPVEKIISDIALLNKLSLKKQNGGFILTRKNH